MPLDVAQYPVGIDSRVEKIKENLKLPSKDNVLMVENLKLPSKDNVLMVGLWGQGGVGKTTLAKAIYNVIFRDFEGSCFLERVRENFKNLNGSIHLQEQLLSQVLLRQTKERDGVAKEEMIRGRLSNKRVLIILDDVDDAEQLSALARREWFGEGSRIIVTTRNKGVLNSFDGDLGDIYEVKVLKDDEALELFKKYALPKYKMPENLIDSALHYAGGLPLGLRVLGSYLRPKKVEQWEKILKALDFKKGINDVLKVSYDGLESYKTKEIFLDIACFFKGRRREYIEKVLDSCGFQTDNEVEILIESSLISEEYGTLQMHDLMQSMGKNIILEECHDDPGKRSRLWLHEDVFDVLSREEGTEDAKAIVLELPEPKKTYISPKAFKKMMKLRLLILLNVDNSSIKPIHLPNGLMYFQWPNCPSTPEFSDGPKKLVRLDMRNSMIQVPRQFEGFEKLKFINFSKCASVTFIPNLHLTPNLEELDLHGCKNLKLAHKSVADHTKLRLLNLEGCSNLYHFLDVLRSKNLQVLNLTGCSKLQKFPNIPDIIKGLEELYLRGTSIEELPASIENLVSLEKLNLIECKKLANLPSSIYKLSNLKRLMLSDCSKLERFPIKEDLNYIHSKLGFPKLVTLRLEGCNLLEAEFLKNHSCFPRLRNLYLSIHNFAKLPTCEHLYKLRNLRVSKCGQLQEIGKIPGQLQPLSAMNCESPSKIPYDMWAVNHIDELLLNKKFHPKEYCEILLPGGEMPQWLLPNEEGYISFPASKDMYNNFLGLIICIVYRVKEGRRKANYRLHVNDKFDHIEGQKRLPLVYSDHVWLRYLRIHDVWRDPLGLIGWSSFQFGIRVSGGVIVKKCGFRIIGQSLEDDSEALYQEEKLLDPGLIYKIWHGYEEKTTAEEIWHDDEETTSEEERHLDYKPWRFHEEGEILQQDPISSDDEDDEMLPSRGGEAHIDLNDIMADFSVERFRYGVIPPFYRDILPGGDMPKEFIHVEGNTISFMVSRDFYDKFLGLALCVVFSVDNGEQEILFDIMPHVNGQRRNRLSGSLGSFDSDHMWIQYLKPNVLWGMLEGTVDFLESDRLHFSLTLNVLGGTMKKFGYMLRCKQMDDDLKVAFEDGQLVDPASIYQMKFGEFLDKFLPRQMEELRRREEEQHRLREMYASDREKYASDSNDNEMD